jgi:hypothetical protein
MRQKSLLRICTTSGDHGEMHAFGDWRARDWAEAIVSRGVDPEGPGRVLRRRYARPPHGPRTTKAIVRVTAVGHACLAVNAQATRPVPAAGAAPFTRTRKWRLESARSECARQDALPAAASARTIGFVAERSPADADPRHPLVAIGIVMLTAARIIASSKCDRAPSGSFISCSIGIGALASCGAPCASRVDCRAGCTRGDRQGPAVARPRVASPTIVDRRRC